MATFLDDTLCVVERYNFSVLTFLTPLIFVGIFIVSGYEANSLCMQTLLYFWVSIVGRFLCHLYYDIYVSQSFSGVRWTEHLQWLLHAED